MTAAALPLFLSNDDRMPPIAHPSAAPTSGRGLAILRNAVHHLLTVDLHGSMDLADRTAVHILIRSSRSIFTEYASRIAP